MITPTWPQLPTDLPPDYLDVMLPELAAKWQLGHDAHQQVLSVLDKQGFQPAINTLSILLTIAMLKGPLQ
jgi:hypothetical protein